jgi:hypothetical protein
MVETLIPSCLAHCAQQQDLASGLAVTDHTAIARTAVERHNGTPAAGFR